MMNSILDFSLDELKQDFQKRGIAVFHAQQIFDWIYQKGVSEFAKMSNLSFGLRQQLEKDYCISKIELKDRLRSSDGTKKFLFTPLDKENYLTGFKLEDGEFIESVFIPTQSRNTVCLSSQVGCKFKCRFCASGLFGFRRNLSCGEIISQLLFIKNLHNQSRINPAPHNNLHLHVNPAPTNSNRTRGKFRTRGGINNIVMMGMGEPLDNYGEVLKAVRVMNDEHGLNIGARKITISTCGLIPEIERLSKEGMQFELSVSLHAADNVTRDFLMPINKKYPLENLINCIKEYIQETDRQVTFEYLLLKDINSSKESAEALVKLLKGMNCKVNIIPYNPVSEIKLYTPLSSQVRLFEQVLIKGKINTTLRRARGKDIDGACGQLRLKKING